MIPAVRWSPGSGRLVKRGSSERATFIRKVARFGRPAGHAAARFRGRRRRRGAGLPNRKRGLTLAATALRPVRLAARDGAGGSAALDDDLVDRRVEDDLDALLARRLGHRLGDRAHAADRMAPGAGHARRLAEQMVEEDVGRARIVGAGIIADDGVEAEQGLDDVGVEIAVEDVGGGLGEEIEQVALLLGASWRAPHCRASAPPARRRGRRRHWAGRAISSRAGWRRPSRARPNKRHSPRRPSGEWRAISRAGEAAAAGEEMVGAERRQEIVDLAQHDLQAVLVEPHVAR